MIYDLDPIGWDDWSILDDVPIHLVPDTLSRSLDELERLWLQADEAASVVMCEACAEREALVGLGQPPAWLCLDCFGANLRAVSAAWAQDVEELA